MTFNAPAFTVLTWGCQMNEDDSNQIASLLMQMGYQPASDITKADVIMLNTCSVRAKPEQKAKSKIGELRELKEANPDLIIGVCGCMAQRRAGQIRHTFPYVDIIAGTAQIERIPEMIRDVLRSRNPLSSLELPRAAQDDPTLPKRTVRGGPIGLKVFVPVMYGCDNFCAYCIVPYVRGKERSRPLDDIVDEVKFLADSGCREVTLLGQNVNSYDAPGGHKADFADLLAAVNEVSGLERIRFTTSHPKDLSDKLISAIAGVPKVCEHIHLPIQAGDNDTLKRMKRGYTVEHYMERVETLRTAVPDVAITTDILVGFPGETDEEFRNTLGMIEKIRFDSAFMFAFNAIERTVAATLPGQVPVKVKNARLSQVIETQNRITIEINTEQVGRVFDVLIEGKSPKNPNRMTGLTRQNKTVNFPSPASKTGDTTAVRTTEAFLYGFSGEEM